VANTRKWTAEDIPDQTGKVVVVTGGNSGLGYRSVRQLARKGAHVVLTCRTPAKGEAARDQILDERPDAEIEVMQLDLADLDAIRDFAGAFTGRYDALHILVNNAGVMATPRRTTADGFELQFGTNHLGHFALTGLLLDVLLQTPESRVVTVSSIAERTGRINFDDLMRESFYERWTAYGQSKLANLLFAYELQRRLEAIDAATISVAAHPGFAATDLRSKLMSSETPLLHRILSYLFEAMSQSAEKGVLPQLYAATARDVEGGAFYGPDGLFQRAGYPAEVRSSPASRDEALAEKLWTVSEALTGVNYQALES